MQVGEGMGGDQRWMIHLKRYQRLRWRLSSGIFSRVIGVAAEFWDVASSMATNCNYVYTLSIRKFKSSAFVFRSSCECLD